MDNDTTIDPNKQQDDPQGQQPPSDQGNDQGQGVEGQQVSPTDFIDFKGVKIPASEFETLAKEKYKDAFEAKDNREKWQAENTRKAQEIAQDKRDAAEYRRLMADRQQNPTQRQDPYQSAKQEYIQDMKRDFPDLDDRFLAKQFDLTMKLAGKTAEEYVNPIHEQQGKAFEAKFLAEHPKVQKGSEQYQEIASLMGSGVDPERAYQIVFHDDILKEKTDLAIKQRDEEATRKLKQSRTAGSPASQSKAKGRQVFEEAWAMYGDK